MSKYRDTCYEELDSCCQTLCNKQDVWNYIRELEAECKMLREQIDELEGDDEQT